MPRAAESTFHSYPSKPAGMPLAFTNGMTQRFARRKEISMSDVTDKAKGKANEWKGKAEQEYGKQTGDEETQAKGERDELKGKGQQFKGKVEDKADDLKDKVSG
jgi:uncharacterized protein YjbJ (UPF0337 family)